MSRNTIDSGPPDIFGDVDNPKRFIGYLQRPPLATTSQRASDDKTQSALDKIIILLRTCTGHDFSLYTKSSLQCRIERRMNNHKINQLSRYVRYLHEDSRELGLLFNELLIGEASFFRDPASWEELRKKILPALITSRPDGHVLRAWVPGCSTGEEAYSLAMLFKKVMEKAKPRKKITFQVFATDVDKDAIHRARCGVYSENICTDVPVEQMNRFFIKEKHGYKIDNEIREMVIFATQNLIMDPPFTKLDILACRNILIHLAPDVQKKLIPLFHCSLNPGGVLFLGSAETVGTFTDLFTPLNKKFRFFRRMESAVPRWWNVATDIALLKRAEEAQRRSDAMESANKELRQEIIRRKLTEEYLRQNDQHRSQMLSQSRHLQEQLRQLSRQILSTQEDERKKISRELHDVIAQTLTGINVQLAALKNDAALNTAGFVRNITRTQRLVEKSVNIFHEFARELRPAALDDLGLIPALHSFTRLFSKQTRIRVNLKVFAGVEQLDSTRRTVLFRVAQEALTNVFRHAHASRVEVSIRRLAGGVSMQIKDDGKSFEVERTMSSRGTKHLGLLGMRERLEMAGGHFHVESAPGEGTTITAHFQPGNKLGGKNRR